MRYKMIKIVRFFLIMGVILLFRVTSQAQNTLTGDTFEQARERGSANITITYVETPAFVYRDDKGELIGICIDILNSFLNYVKNQHGITVNLTYHGDGKDFRKFYNEVKDGSGGVIGLGNVTVKEERKKEVAFTPPYIRNMPLLVSGTSVNDVANVSEIGKAWAGYSAFVPVGTTHEERMMKLKKDFIPDLNIIYTGSSQEALNKVIETPNSICFQDIALYWDYKERGMDIKYHPVINMDGEDLAMIMPLDSDWMPVFNEFFSMGAGFKSRSIYRNSLIKHLGNEVVKMVKMAQ